MIRNQPDKGGGGGGGAGSGGGGGRRPLLVTFTGNNRQMLNEIRDNLSHLRKNDINDLSNVLLKQDLSQSTPNLLEKPGANKGTRRDNQHHKALAEIRDSLRPYQNATQTNGSYPSNRINSNATTNNNNAAVAGSSGGYSDNSSTTSSSSSHTALDQEVNPMMVQEIIKHGFDTEIAIQSLRLSGNQSVEAALRLLQSIVDKIKEGVYPPKGTPPQSVLPTYQQRPNFGPRSPSTSESANSIRSDSPGLSQAPPTAHHTRHLLANGQAPPPLPPREPIREPNPGQTPPPPSSSSASYTLGVIDGINKLSIASSMANSNLIAQQSLPNQSSGLVISGGHINKGKMGGANPGLHPHNSVLDQSDIPQGHVKQLIQLISPQASPQSYYSLQQQHQHQQHQQQQQQQQQQKHHPPPHHSSPQQPQPQQPPQINGGPFLGQRGVSPVPINSQQQQQPPIIMGTSTNSSASNTPAPSPLLSQQIHSMILSAQQGGGGWANVTHAAGSTSSNSPSPAPSSCGSSSVQHSLNFPQGPPPPYSQAQAQIQAARLGIVLPAGASLITTHTEHSSSSVVVSENQKKVVANKAVSATCMPMDSSHLPVIMKSVKSKEVQKPMPQTATIPIVPPTTSGGNGGGGGAPINGLPPQQQHTPSTNISHNHLPTPSSHPHYHHHHHQQQQQQQQQHHHHHHPNKPLTTPSPVPPSSASAFPVSHSSRSVVMTGKREVNVSNIHISHSQPHYPPHLLRPTATNQEGSNNRTPEQLVALASATTGQPTILNSRMTRQNLFSQTPTTNQLLNNNSSNTTTTLGNVKGNHHPHSHHHHSPPNPFTDPSISTPRSDSPVSRVTNQSPLSVLSTTSSPSTNSDIPDRLPPPYPGLLMGQAQPSPHPHHHMNPPPLLPPRVPLKPTTPPPPDSSDPSSQFIISPHHQSIPAHIVSSMPKNVPPSHLPSKFTQQDQSSSSSSPSPSSPIHVTGPLQPPPPPHPSASTSSPYAQQQTQSLSSSNTSNNSNNNNNNMASSNLPQMDNNNSNTNNNNNNHLLNSNNNSNNHKSGLVVPNSVLSSETEETDTDTSIMSQSPSPAPGKTSNNHETHRCMSPLPERNMEAKERDMLRSDTKVRIYSPQAFKFYMEQHVENVLKSHSQRVNRKLQLEKEMAKANLSDEAACQMRKMLHQKESNYIRLKRAKMESSMFEKLKTLGVGAFGEVALVRKRDVGNLYAMKTLQKNNVIKRNQVAHVKAERDILAEADNEWVVKLYYSFQDRDNLYFVMDYVPGGDLMGLLIRMEILPENMARFYIAELVLAIESVHRMGFIHRDIKPDNILIDQEGHIKLTDFGLCTGFRWTHNSMYYQKDGSHARQDSMEVSLCQLDDQCRCEILKPLEQRRQREQKRCLAHSLVGTPNYIAPEVLLRQGYTKACDWWSVGVILYEMVIGSPPFYASTPAETQYKVINWKDTLCIRHDANISPATSKFIVRLLQGSETRLGKEGATQVKDHDFFKGINFEGLRRQQAFFKPTIRSMTDTSNFDPVDPEKLHSDSDCSRKDHSKQENGKLPEHAFYEFTFRRFFDDGGPASLPPPQLPPPDSSDTNSPVYV